MIFIILNDGAEIDPYSKAEFLFSFTGAPHKGIFTHTKQQCCVLFCS